MTYPFQLTVSGRDTSRRPKQKNDCVVRAIVEVTGRAYDDVYDELAALGRKCGKGFAFSKYVATNPVSFGVRFRKISFPAVKGQRRMNPLTFSQRFNKGIYIVKTAKHVFAFKNGVAYDCFKERDDRCIYTAWEIL